MGVSLSRWWIVAGLVALAAGALLYATAAPADAGELMGDNVRVIKVVEDPDQAYDDEDFVIDLSCSDGTEETLTLAATEFNEFTVEPGATCTATEDVSALPPAPEGCVWDDPMNDSGTALAEQVLILDVRNGLNCRGDVKVTKTISGDTGGYLVDSTFEVMVSCSRNQVEGPSETFNLVAGGMGTLSGVRGGSTCIASEPNQPPAQVGYIYLPPVFLPTDTVTIVPGETVELFVDNPLRAARILVVKETEPDGSPQPFEFEADWDEVGFTLTDGQSEDSGPLADGTYEVTELVPEGWELTSVVCDADEQEEIPSGARIFLSAGEVVTCTFTNTEEQPETGEILVTKETVPEGSTQEFNFTLTGPDEFSDSFSASDGETVPSGPLPPGGYAVSEDVPDGWVLTSATCDDGSPVDAIVLQAGETVTCTFVNTEEQDLTGAFSVTKTISGDTEGYVGGEFGFVAQCGDSEVSFALEPGETFTSEALPVGTECVIVEVLALLPELAEGFTFGVITFDPDQTVTIAADSVSPVTVDNPILELGRLTIAKTLSGFAEGYDPATSFTVTVDCDDDSVDQSVQVTPTQSATIVGIPFGTECTLTETLPAPLPGFIYGTPSFDPSNTVSITSENPDVTVTIDNPLDPPGFIDVTKRVSGGTAPAGSSFGFRLDCDNDAFDQTFTLTPDATVRLGPIAEFTVCTVVETSVPAGFGTPSFSPSATVTVPPNGVVAVTVTNPVTAIAFTGSSALLPMGLAFVLIGGGIVLIAFGPLRRRSEA